METQNLVKLLLILFVSTGLAACNGKVLDKDANSVEKAEVVDLTRHWQRVIRYTCAGALISDQIETVKSPRTNYTIKPNTYEKIFSTSFRNLTNGKVAGSIVNHDTFVLDMADATFDLKAEVGVNEIKYEFYYCDLVGADGRCTTGADLKEQGSVFLNVNYEERTLEGFKEIRESCPTPTPSPTP